VKLRDPIEERLCSFAFQSGRRGVPLYSFSRGLKKILAAEKNPYFWYYDRDKAVKI
jgi:hypothetical protein